MATLRDIKKRMISVGSTQKITRAMKMVSAARLKKIQQTVLKNKIYVDHLKGMLLNVAERACEKGHPLMSSKNGGHLVDPSTAPSPAIQGREGGPLGVNPEHAPAFRSESRRVDLIVITSDRGLCGALNENLTRRIVVSLERYHLEGNRAILAKVLGKKGRDYFASRNYEMKDFILNWGERVSVEMAEGIVKECTDRFLAGENDQVVVVYNRFKSVGRQDVVYETLLPAAITVNGPTYTVDYIYEPTREELLNKLVWQVMVASVYQVLCEALASELAARLLAMDKAVQNAEEMIRALTGRYNRQRQSLITTELMDIITGVEAMK